MGVAMKSLFLTVLLFSLPALAGNEETATKRAYAIPGKARVQAKHSEGLSAYAGLAWSQLPETLRGPARAILTNPKAPVLLLPREALEASDTLLISGPHWYSLSYSRQGVTVTLLVRQAAISAPWLAKHRRHGPVLSRDHGVVTLGLSAGGAALTLDVECMGGSKHPLCGDDDAIWSLANSLLWVKAER